MIGDVVVVGLGIASAIALVAYLAIRAARGRR